MTPSPAQTWADLTPLTESATNALRQLAQRAKQGPPLLLGNRDFSLQQANYGMPVLDCADVPEWVLTVRTLKSPGSPSQKVIGILTIKLIQAPDKRLYPWLWDDLTPPGMKNVEVFAVRFQHVPLLALIDPVKQRDAANRVNVFLEKLG